MGVETFVDPWRDGWAGVNGREVEGYFESGISVSDAMLKSNVKE